MTVTVTTEPTYVLPGKTCEVTAACSVGNFVRMVLTSAPEASEYSRRVRAENRSELQLWTEESGQKHKFTFDVPGTYVFAAREYTKGGVYYGGGYSGDPLGAATETYVASTTVNVNVGQRMTAPITVGRDTGTLTLYVWGSTIRPTTIPTHGEVSPRIDGQTERMKTAAASGAVVATLTALDNVACATAAPSLATALNDLIAKWNAHIAKVTGSPATHTVADISNAIPASYSGASTPDALRETVTFIASRMRRHYTNDTGTGVGTALYHSAADWDNLPQFTGVGDTLSASLALASLWRSYEAHRVDSVHGSSDATNTLNALAPLYAVYSTVMGVLASDNPTAPTTDNAGATLLAHRAGLTRA